MKNKVTSIISVFLFSNLCLLFEIISGVTLSLCVSDANKLTDFHFKQNSFSFFPPCLAWTFEQSVLNRHTLNSTGIILECMNPSMLQFAKGHKFLF